MKIVVLCGGISSEREISLRTSTKVAKALKSRGHQVVMIDIFFGAEQCPSFSDEQDFDQAAESLRALNHLVPTDRSEKRTLLGKNVLALCKASDIVFIGLHGEYGEDGKVQAVFEKEGIKYTGSDSKSSAIAMSKTLTKKLVSPFIRMPQGLVHKAGEAISLKTPVPCIIKPSNGGSSLGVFRVWKSDEYEKALQDCYRFDSEVLAEEFVEGRELTQAVLNGVALPPVEIISEKGEWYDYTNKYSGFTKEVCPAEIPDSVLKEMSEKSIRFGEILGLSVYYRIDYLLDKNGVLYALEANSLPGMTDTSLVPQEAAAIGLSYPELCEKIIEISLDKYKS